MCKISIITVSYNSEKTIERTIRSVLNQSFTDYEYIIIDGASSDSTLSVVKEYEPRFQGRMKWKSEPDTGIYNAMNKGIFMAKGAIIGIVNSDDWLEQSALSLVYDSYVNNNCDNRTLYCGDIYFHTKAGSIKEYRVYLGSFYLQTRFYVMAGIRHPAVFVPKEIYNRVGYFNEKMRLSADQDFILRCYFQGIRFLNIGCAISNMSEGGISTEDSVKSFRIAKQDREIMLTSFGKKGLIRLWLLYSWVLRRKIKMFISKNN